MAKVNYVCSHCGSDQVKLDAWAMWDVDAQEFVTELTSMNNGWCDACDCETTIKEVPYEEAR